MSTPSTSTSYIMIDGPNEDQCHLTTAAQNTSPNNPVSAVAGSSPGHELAIKRQTLTLVLPPTEEGGRAYYAIVPFPETYDDAVVAAVRVLGSYMTDPRPENVLLKCSAKNREGEWVWANIEPVHWKLVLSHNGDEVAAFEKRRKDIMEEFGFLHGKLCLTIGETDGVETKWTHVSPHMKDRCYDIDRPKTFTEAVELVKHWLARSGPYRSENVKWMEKCNSADTKYTFYYFTNQDVHVWAALPPVAYTNDEVWRLIVPPPGHMLGVQIS